MGKLSTEGRSAEQIASVLAILNNFSRPQDLAGIEPQQGPVVDDPHKGYGDQAKDYDIGIKVASNILAERHKLPAKKFISITELEKVKGFGQDKLNDLFYSASLGLATEIKVLLTFDDGPHNAGMSSNYTKKVVDVLARNNIKACFFVQTHSVDVDGREFRLGGSNGKTVATLAHSGGNLIQIHTGSREDHVLHTIRVTKPAYDTDGDGKADGNNALESDMIQAKRRIRDFVGESPKYVRAVGGSVNGSVLGVYAQQNLRHIGWDIDSMDSHGFTALKVREVLKNSIETAIKNNKTSLCVLFHDVNKQTANSLESYIATITDTIKRTGRKTAFTSSSNQVHAFLSSAQL